MRDDGALVALLQLTSGGFPTGAFAHSYGLEPFVQSGLVRDVVTFGEWLDVHLAHSAGPTDGAGIALVGRAVTAGDWDAVLRIDRLLTALKLAPEVRAASRATGRATLRAPPEVFPRPALENYAGLIDDRRAPGNAAAGVACIAADLQIRRSAAVLAFLWSGDSS